VTTRPTTRREADIDLTGRMLHLRQIPVATMVPSTVLRELAHAMRDRTFASGRHVLHEGEPMDAMYLLTEGTLTLTKREHDARAEPRAFGEIKAPQTIGFLPILARQPTPYDAVARGEVRALELPTDTLLDLMADHFELLAATLRYFAERLWLEFQELPAAALGIAPVDVGPIPSGRIDLAPRILMFRKTSGFATANINALAVLARQVEETRLPAGTRLWEAGDRADRVIFLVQGSVACVTPDGREFRYGTGTGVGGIEAIAGRPRWYSATAETPIVGFWGHTENLFDLFEHQLRMAMDFVSMLARAQIGILERKAKLGHDPLAGARTVTKLGAIRYGA
jgi:CRP-like cAMP-binding protein